MNIFFSDYLLALDVIVYWHSEEGCVYRREMVGNISFEKPFFNHAFYLN